ncbi:aminoglycoside phosphotransferase family protein [Solwaraspora sp. WMMD1047]|uniref:phosphotransferase family protein n=1 Tax=Solwaraspora sp. WMMD1047 TaxID=3016102 RepID=UPI002417BF83|nr:aminoglycoside phosphotransferase family protein [Solwaraspora sp. WMMD1047]MDG4830186.1 aminoglycoside phosphotransferase family protein [Solwaraspora sp. WMMD1047]
MSRTVTLLLVDPLGAPLGALPPYQVAMPWWQEVSDVVDGARERFGVDVSVLRLVDADRSAPPGGALRYLAQLDRAPDGAPTFADAGLPDPAVLAPHPLRAPWAVPGGPTRSLHWAAAALARLGRAGHTAIQQRAWNLSAIWRLEPTGPTGATAPTAPTAPTGAMAPGGPVWLKQVPPFFRHEAAVLRWLGEVAPGAAPTLLAADDGPAGQGRLLLDHVPGEDRYGAELAERHAIGASQHRIQTLAAGRTAELVARGVPDGRGVALARTVRGELARHGADLGPVRDLLDGLADRLARVASCGVPETLVHGDLHPGNVRSDGRHPVIIDWGDSFVGPPAFDILRLAEGLPPPAAAELLAAWRDRWRRDVPGCDPDRAVALLRPVAALRNAAMYAGFLARIEPSEHPFHAADVPAWLRLAAEWSGPGTSDCR